MNDSDHDLSRLEECCAHGVVHEDGLCCECDYVPEEEP